MLIRHDPDAFETVTTHRTCAFHRKNPGEPFAGCTCGGGVGLRRVSETERLIRRLLRMKNEREELIERLQETEREIERLASATR